MSQSFVSWQDAPTSPQLKKNEVHIWCADLNIPETLLTNIAQNLNSDEQIRATRFIRERDRVHFTAARAILRDILSRYCKMAAKDIEFNYSAKGKPSLKITSLQPMIFFNLSHTHDLAIYGVTTIENIGIDIEYIKRDMEALEIAERFFSKDEVSLLRQLPTAEQLRGFYKIWTRKEAFVKAIGEGISHPLDQFSVNLLSGKSKIVFHDVNQSLGDWFIYDVPVNQDYIAALSSTFDNVIIQRWRWHASDGY